MIISFLFNFFSINFCVIVSFFDQITIISSLNIVNFFNQFIIFILFSLFKQTGIVSNSPIYNLSILLLKLFKPLGTFFSLSISNLSTSDFKLGKSDFLAKSDV